jgi:hypothetical protein
MKGRLGSVEAASVSLARRQHMVFRGKGPALAYVAVVNAV